MPRFERAGAVSEARLDALFRVFDQCRLPGVAVGVAIDGAPVYRKAFGLANMELPILLTPQTRMRIGSISKQFVALLTLILSDRMGFSIDAPVSSLRPDVPPSISRATLRQLLSHTSGIRDVHEIAWRFSGTEGRATSDALFALYAQISDEEGSPSQTFKYNNGGYLVVSTILEGVAGESLETLLAKEIFRPLGMLDTVLRRTDRDFLSGSACLHENVQSGNPSKIFMGTDLAGEGGIVSTVDDMLRWARNFSAPIICSQEAVTQLQTPIWRDQVTGDGYGFGIRTSSYRGIAVISHSGGVVGGNAHLAMVPELGLAIIVLMNRRDRYAAELANRIIDCWVAAPAVAPAADDAFRNKGLYRSLCDGRIVLLFEKARKQFACIDGVDFPMVWASALEMRPGPPFDQTSYLLRMNSRAGEELTFDDHGLTERFERIEPADPSPTLKFDNIFVGTTAPVEVRLSVDEAGSWLDARGSFGMERYALTPCVEDTWLARSARGAVIVSLEGPDALFITTPRLNRLPLRRKLG